MRRKLKFILCMIVAIMLILGITVNANFKPGQALFSSLKTALNIQQKELKENETTGEDDEEVPILVPEITIGEITLKNDNLPEGTNQIVTIPVTTKDIPNDSKLGVKLIKDGIDVTLEDYTVEGNTVTDNLSTIILNLGTNTTKGDYIVELSYEYLVGPDAIEVLKKQAQFTVDEIKIQEIIIEQKAITLEKYETTIITYRMVPDLFTDADLKFTSDNEEVAIISEGGLITGVGKGETTVRISSLDGSVEASIPVTVLEPSIEIIEVTSEPEQVMQDEEGSFNVNIQALDFQNEKQLDVTIYKHQEDVTGLFNIEGNVVQGNEVNLVIKPNIGMATSGEYTISVTYDGNPIDSEDMEKQSATFKIYGKVPITGFKVEQEIIRMTVDEERQIITNITPEDAQNKKLIYRSDSPEIVGVDENGLVESLALGTAKITITSDEDATLEKVVEVRVMELIGTEEYNIDLENRVIKNIPENTTVEFLLQNLQIGSDNYRIENNSGETLTEAALVGTGSLLKINESEIFNIVVTGDTNGDGKISITDLSKLKLHLVKLELLENLSLIGADINQDGETTLTDLSRMKEYLVGM